MMSSVSTAAAAPLRIAALPSEHRPHFTHAAERVWPKTNCYFDLCIELVHSMGLDPVPAFVSVLSADHDGELWSFIKPPAEDLRCLYGLEVAEVTMWRTVPATIESGLRRGMLHTVEVDSWWLPDTIGDAYHAEHVKTAIVPTRLDVDRGLLHYLHNDGLYELGGEDFAGIFTPTPAAPYIEQIRWYPDRAQPDALTTAAAAHLRRRPADNPVERLAASVEDALGWLPEAGMDVFHAWAFANLRQFGATAELAADLAACLDDQWPGAARAVGYLHDVAADAKQTQFKLARAAAGRSISIGDLLVGMADNWQRGIDIVADAVC